MQKEMKTEKMKDEEGVEAEAKEDCENGGYVSVEVAETSEQNTRCRLVCPVVYRKTCLHYGK